MNTDGLLVRTRIFEGNTGDCTTMQQIMASLVKEQIRKGKNKEDITVVMDAGISTKENIEYLKNNNFKFITVARSTGIKYKSAGEGIQTVLDNKKQEIRLEKVKVEGSTNSYLLVDSKAKTLKERSMYDRSCAYFEEGLKAIQNGIEKKGGTKKLDKVCERLGRLKEECPAVWRDYTIEYDHDKKNIVTVFRWIKSKTESLSTETKHGKYLLHTNLDEKQEKNIWFFYNVIREVESTFKCLKSDLDIRPIYHKSDEGTKAHLNLAVLAYWVASTVRYQLKRKDMHNSWSEIVRILQTHKVVSTRVTKEDDSQVEIRQCTEPNEKVTQLYQALELTQEPLKRRKFVVHPKPPLEKTRIVKQEISTG